MKIFITQLFLFLFTFAAFAQENLSLEEAIVRGIENNYQIQIDQRNIQIAENNNDWAVAGKTPRVSANLNGQATYTNQNNPASFFTSLNTTGLGVTPGLSANWTLFDGYRIRFTKDQLGGIERLQRKNAMLTVENTVQSVILAYYNVLIQQEQLSVLREVLELSNDRVAYQEVRKEFGQAGTFDVLQTQDAYLNDSTSLLIQLNSIETAFLNLNLAMGVDEMSQNYTLTDQLVFAARDYTYEELQEQMLNRNQNLQVLRVNQELAQINSNIQKSAMYPQLSVGANTTYNVNLNNGTGTANDGREINFDGITAKTFNGGLNFTASYTIFDGGVRNKQLQNAQVEEEIAELNIEAFKRNANNQLANTLATYNNQKRLLDLTQLRIDNAQRNIEIAEERFRGGLINSFDYRTIQLNYVNSAQARLNAIFNLRNTETELVRITGGLVR
ncbi:MAG: TolC family protein [Saprospiraceae bacterium]